MLFKLWSDPLVALFEANKPALILYTMTFIKVAVLIINATFDVSCGMAHDRLACRNKGAVRIIIKGEKILQKKNNKKKYMLIN